MVVEAIVAGKPAPFCKWKQGSEDVLTSNRLSVVKTLTSCTLIIKHVTRKDSGYYSLSAENSTGKVNQILRVTVMGEGSPFPGCLQPSACFQYSIYYMIKLVSWVESALWIPSVISGSSFVETAVINRT